MKRCFDEIRQDFSFALRQFARQPRFWTMVLVTLVVGIAASTSIFAVVDGVLLKPLPYREPERLVSLTTSNWRGEYFHLSERARTFDVAAYYPGNMEVTLSLGGEPLRVPAAGVTADLFDVLGVQPALGRPFTVAEMSTAGAGIVGGNPSRTYGAAILSARIWRSYFGASPDAIGARLSIDGEPHTIVGVMPEGFGFPSADTELWFPHNIDPATLWFGNVATMIARLTPGYGIEDATAELRTLSGSFRDLIPYGRFLAEDYTSAYEARPLTEAIVGEVRPVLLVLLAAIGVVLLVLCVNVANLLLARGAARERELATRAALGAGRRRLVRQLLVENVTVAAAAGVVGTLVSAASLRMLVALLPADLPRIGQIHMDMRVLLFAFTVALAAGVAFGVLPALRATRADGSLLGRGGGVAANDGREGRLTRLLAAIEFSFAVVLVVAAVMLLQSLWNLTRVDPGFRPEQLAAARIAPPGFADWPYPARHDFASRLLDRLGAAPEVRSVAVANAIPADPGLFGAGFQAEGETPDGGGFTRVWLGVGASYHATMGIALLEGRPFTAADRADSARVAIVSRRLARANWGEESAVGKRVRFSDGRQFPGPAGDPAPWFTVVGVVDDVRFDGLTSDLVPILYIPFEQHWDVQSLRVVIRSDESAGAIASLLRSIVVSLDPQTPVSDFRTLDATLGETIARPRFTALLFGGFAAVAIFLAAVGVYGVLSYAMSRRIPEIGIRMAFGADARRVFGLLFGQGMRLAALGIAIGLPFAFATMRLLSGLLVGVDPLEIGIFAAVAGVLLLVGVAASYLPARRAARVDPMHALRQE